MSASADRIGTMGYTHVIEYDGGSLTREISHRRDISVFAQTLQKFNGTKPWALTLWAIPAGVTYDQMLAAGELPTRYLQAGGRAEAMALQIRKPGTDAGGMESIRYIVGHPHDGTPALDVPITLGRNAEIVSAPEVFEAAEAAEVFFVYYQTGDIPSAYSLRPVQGWAADGTSIDLCQHT